MPGISDPILIWNERLKLVAAFLNAIGLGMYFLDPSPVSHIARYSTIGHGGNDGRRNAYRLARHDVSLLKQVPIK
jgi:hypothetical protein